MDETAWANEEAALEGRVTSYQGLAHCDQEGATIMRMDWPLDSTTSQSVRTYARDPEGVFAGVTEGSFEADVAIPPAATDTGFSSKLGDLWMEAEVDDVVYVRTDDRVEAWPRTNTVVGCD